MHIFYTNVIFYDFLSVVNNSKKMDGFNLFNLPGELFFNNRGC